MTDIFRVKLHNAQQACTAINALYRTLKPYLLADHQYELTVKPATRSSAQNRLMWKRLGELADQVKWFGKHMTKEGWKEFITGHLKGAELVPNMDGTGFISINGGCSTSDMTIAEMTAVIDLIMAFGAQNDVRFSALEYMEEATA